MPISPDAPLLHIQFGGTPSRVNSKRFLFIQNRELKESSEETLLSRIFDKLISRNILYSGFTKNFETPKWLLAGIIFHFRYELHKWSPADFIATRYSVNTNKYPSLRVLLNDEHAPPITEPLLYQVYYEQCGVLLTGLNRLPGQGKILYKAIVNEDTNSLINFLLKNKNKFTEFNDITDWYIKLCKKSLYGSFISYTTENIAAKINSLLTVSIARPGGQGIKEESLEALSSEEIGAIDHTALALIEKELYEVILHSPKIFHKSLTIFIQASFKLRLQKSANEDFKKNIKTAQKRFKRVLQLQRDREKYHKELEAKLNLDNFSTAELFHHYETIKKLHHQLFPRWNDYLDKLEQKLEEASVE
ncbi:MAG: hypothetical protein HRT88_21080 [Lentisphaeraceae bacterium]|nr:hypothetical protein [Lentisphaeraceae bacterium]